MFENPNMERQNNIELIPMAMLEDSNIRRSNIPEFIPMPMLVKDG